MPDTSQNNRLEKREALDLALFHKLTSGDGTRRQGVIVVPGGLHLDTPWTSTDGATVIPIR